MLFFLLLQAAFLVFAPGNCCSRLWAGETEAGLKSVYD
jgi:hypothetical protein